MGTRLYPLKDSLPITRRTKRSLKKEMRRWLRRQGRSRPNEGLRTRRHRGWYW